MNDIPAPPHKPLVWIGPSLDELMEMPEDVRRHMGFALRFAQAGIKHDHAKPLKGFKGAGVLEVVEDYDGDTYRAIYTVKFVGVVYVLHCFQKKAKKGIATPQPTIELIKRICCGYPTLQSRRPGIVFGLTRATGVVRWDVASRTV